MHTLILNIETTTKNCSVSLSKNGQLIALKEINEGGYSHAENLHPFIDAVLQDTQYNYTDLSAIAVSKGPGSYTYWCFCCQGFVFCFGYSFNFH